MIAEIIYKEVGSDHTKKTSYSAPNITEEQMISFFGLDKSDIEWYKIYIN